MSSLRKQIIEILAKDGWITEEDQLYPAQGYWRSSPYADVYRWEGFSKRPGSNIVTQINCWQTMTEFVRLAKKYGFSYDPETDEICANESKLE